MPPGFEDKVLKVARVVKVVKGGRRFSFSAYVVVGNRRGRIGFGHGKANEVQDAVKKATKAALKNSFLVPIVKDTIPHGITHKFLATRLLIKPAKEGRGLVAAGTVRSIVELAGFTNITTKVYGSRNVQNVARCLLRALSMIRSAGEIRTLRQEATTRR